MHKCRNCCTLNGGTLFPYNTDAAQPKGCVKRDLHSHLSQLLSCGHISTFEKDLFPAVICFHNIQGSYGWWGLLTASRLSGTESTAPSCTQLQSCWRESDQCGNLARHCVTRSDGVWVSCRWWWHVIIIIWGIFTFVLQRNCIICMAFPSQHCLSCLVQTERQGGSGISGQTTTRVSCLCLFNSHYLWHTGVPHGRLRNHDFGECNVEDRDVWAEHFQQGCSLSPYLILVGNASNGVSGKFSNWEEFFPIEYV